MAVASSDGIAVIAGDSIQNATVAREWRNALVFWNDKLATRSIKLLAIGDVIYPGHDLPFRLTSDGHAEYLHDMELTLTGIEAGEARAHLAGRPRVAPNRHARDRRTTAVRLGRQVGESHCHEIPTRPAAQAPRQAALAAQSGSDLVTGSMLRSRISVAGH